MSFALKSLFDYKFVEIEKKQECTVIGNSGILLHRNYKGYIEGTNGYVVRCNDAPLIPSTTNRNEIRVVVHSAVSKMSEHHFKNCKYCVVWFPKDQLSNVQGGMRKFQKSNPNTIFLQLTDSFLHQIYHFYTQLTGIPKIQGIWVSTGFIAFTLAHLYSLEKVNLMGFGAFAPSHDKAPWHYYGSPTTKDQKELLKSHKNHYFMSEAKGIANFAKQFPDKINIFP